jgi:branched-chain amino acid transport system permease protein
MRKHLLMIQPCVLPTWVTREKKMIQFLDMILIGISAASIYSLMAISMVLVWRSTRVVNFAQAGMALFSTYIGYQLITVVGNFWIALPLAMILGAAFSAFIEFFLMRTLLKHSKPGAISAIGPIIATLGLLGVITASIGFIWGHSDIQIVAPLSKVGFTFGANTIVLSPMGLFVILFVTFLVFVVSFIFQKTNVGLALRAAAFSPEIAQLAGVRVSGVRTLGWAMAGAAGAAAGLLQTVNGTGGITPESLEFSLLLVFGFIAAVIGGLESLPGAVLGALILGLVLAFVQIYISGTFVFLVAFILLLVVLLVKPEGFLGSKAGRRA